jgi:hypothetical protein
MAVGFNEEMYRNTPSPTFDLKILMENRALDSVETKLTTIRLHIDSATLLSITCLFYPYLNIRLS